VNGLSFDDARWIGFVYSFLDSVEMILGRPDFSIVDAFSVSVCHVPVYAVVQDRLFILYLQLLVSHYVQYCIYLSFSIFFFEFALASLLVTAFSVPVRFVQHDRGTHFGDSP